MSTSRKAPIHPEGRDRPLLAITLKTLSMVFFALMFAGVKWSSPTIPVGEMVFCRAFFGMLIIVLAVQMTRGVSHLATSRLRTHATRSLLGVTAMFCNFMAVMFLPLADATAVSFVAPMFTVVLAALILKEAVHIYRWSAVVVGFLGVLVIIGAEGGATNADSLTGATLALFGAGFSAFAMIVLRRMSAHENSEAIAFYFMLTSALVSLVTIFWGWVVPTPTEMLVLLSMGFFGGIGQLLLSFSYRYGEASVLALFDYTMMIWATATGYFLFDQLPTLQVLLGAALVIGAGLLILWRERMLGRQRALRAQSL